MRFVMPIKIAAFVFLLVGLVHLSRLVFQFDLVIGNWMVPLWVNGVGALLSLILSFYLFKSLKHFAK